MKFYLAFIFDLPPARRSPLQVSENEDQFPQNEVRFVCLLCKQGQCIKPSLTSYRDGGPGLST